MSAWIKMISDENASKKLTKTLKTKEKQKYHKETKIKKKKKKKWVRCRNKVWRRAQYLKTLEGEQKI